MRIKYTARICEDKQRIDAFLTKARSGVLGLNAGQYPYALPLNFVWLDGTVYFHGMGSGKKFDLLSDSPSACFTVYEELGTSLDPVPCHADTAYFSVMLFGKAERVTDFTESSKALQELLQKYMPGYYRQSIGEVLVEKYRSSTDGNGVAVYRIVPDELTAKVNDVPEENLFKG